MHREFETFRAGNPGAHLVAGRIVGEASSGELRRIRQQVRALVESMGTVGDYATAWVRSADQTEIYCLFAEAGDARAFAASFGSRRCAAQGYGSQHRFTIDAAVRDGLRSPALDSSVAAGARA